MNLDFSALADAIRQLEKSLAFANSDLAKNDAELFEQFRNSVIQCYEFTYELSHKMLARYLQATAANPDALDFDTFQTLIRMGNEKGLLRSDWTAWRTYRQARTDSSQTYNPAKAEAVYLIAAEFLMEANYLHQQLQSRSQHDAVN
jgi:nucleotidyltransferase substrate binding protein (TIGR01987 family)